MALNCFAFKSTTKRNRVLSAFRRRICEPRIFAEFVRSSAPEICSTWNCCICAQNSQMAKLRCSERKLQSRAAAVRTSPQLQAGTRRSSAGNSQVTLRPVRSGKCAHSSQQQQNNSILLLRVIDLRSSAQNSAQKTKQIRKTQFLRVAFARLVRTTRTRVLFATQIQFNSICRKSTQFLCLRPEIESSNRRRQSSAKEALLLLLALSATYNCKLELRTANSQLQRRNNENSTELKRQKEKATKSESCELGRKTPICRY